MRYHVLTIQAGESVVHADVKELNDARSIAEFWSKTSGTPKFVTDDKRDPGAQMIGQARNGVWSVMA